MNTKAFAECMKRNMDKQGITVEVLLKITGITDLKLEECLSGDYKPKAKELFAIAEAIKVPPLVLKSGGGMTHSLVIDEDGKKIGELHEY